MKPISEAAGYFSAGETAKYIHHACNGLVQTLPQPFHTSLEIVLNANVPMFLVWGREHLLFYNDAFKPLAAFRGKHPDSLGKDIRKTWPSLWNNIQQLSAENKRSAPLTLHEFSQPGVCWNLNISRLSDEETAVIGILREDIATAVHTNDSARQPHHADNAEQLFRNVVKSAHIGIAIFSGDDYTCEVANDVYLELVDKHEDEFIGKKIFDSIPEVRPEIEPLFERIYQTGEIIQATEFEVTLKRHEKYEQVFFNFVYQPLKDGQGKTNGILVIASDVTPQVLARHALSERERNFSKMVMQSPIAMTIFRGPDYVIELANDILVKNIWRRKREEVIGKKVLEVFPELNDQKYPALLKKVFTEGVAHREKESLTFVNGDDGMKQFYFDFEYAPLKEQDGSVSGIMITVNDVTDRVIARQHVEDAEARMRIAVEGTGTATWDLNLLTMHIKHSPKLATFFGHPENIVLTHESMRKQLVTEDRLNIVEPAFEQAMKTGLYEYESRVTWPDQSIHWIKTQGKVVFDDEGKPLRMLGTMNEITFRKEAEKTSSLLASIVQSTDDPIISKTTEGIITSWNEAAERTFGYHASEMIGSEIGKLFPQGYEDEEPRILSRLKQGIRVEHFETVRKHKSGRLINVSLTISPIKDASGKVIGASKIARDITEQKRIEKQMKETQQQLEIVIEASELGTWELNLQTSELRFSDRYLEITCGRQLQNPSYEDLKKLLHPDDLKVREQAFKDAFISGALFYTTRLIWPDNTIRWVEARGKVFYDQNNKASKLIGTIRDITDERSFQQALLLSEQRFRNVADTAPVMIWMVGPDKKYTFLNKFWLDFTHLSIEEENEGDYTKGIHPDDYESTVPAYIEAFDKRENFYFEYRLRRHDGEYRWVSDTGTPQFNADGNFEGYIGACMDIHDRIIFEQKLTESESRLRIAALSSELGTWTYYPATRELLWDNASRELFGIDANTPVTLELFWSKVHPDDREEALGKMMQALDPNVGDTYDTEYRVTGLPGNSTRWIHAKGKAIFENNEPVMFAGTVLDITEKRLALEDLQESEQKFRLLADSMPQLIWTGDAEGNLKYFNQSVYDYSGKSPEQLADGGWISIVHPDDKDENVKQWMLAVRSGKPFLFEHRFRRFDGSYRWQLSRAIPQRDADGYIQQWVGTSTDIHDQKTSVEDLEHQVKLRTKELNMANEELTKSNAELAQFAYVASHDLQEPLRKIQTFSNRIVEMEISQLSERGIDYFNRIQAASQRMQQLIIDLLSFSRANTSEKHFEVTDLNAVLKTVSDQLRESINQKKAQINSDKLPVISVISYQFEQLLTNLISNAIKFSKPGIAPVIHIGYDVVDGTDLGFFNVDRSGKYHHFTVSDNGIGFSDEYKERIFQVFQRLHGRDKYEGTGIGLAIVKKIVENHNGYISAHGVDNEGARFDIYLPAVQ